MNNGLFIALLAFASYSGSDAFMKMLGSTLSIFQIAFFMTIFSFIPLYFAKPKEERWRDLIKMRYPIHSSLRILFAIGSGMCVIYAFSRLAFAQVYSIIFFMPLAVTIISYFVLKEPVGWRRWSAVVVGILGVMLVVRPGFSDIQLSHFVALFAAFLSACNIVIMRMIGSQERRTTMMITPGLGVILVNGLLMSLDFRMPTSQEFIYLFFAGVLAGGGYLGLLAAMRLSAANRVAPLQYSQIIWSLVYGVLIFDEFPDRLAIIGMFVVMFSGLFTFIREEQRFGWGKKTPLDRPR